MKETKLYEKLRPQLQKWGAVDRIENAIGSGVSDVFYNICGHMGWIETKLEKNGELFFEKFQLPWMRKHVNQGGNIYVVTMDKYMTINVYPAKYVVRAAVRAEGKWTVVDTKLLTPILTMTAPYREWNSFKDILIS